VERCKAALDQAETIERSREQHKPLEADEERAPGGEKRRIEVNEPDMYTKRSNSFLRDLYLRDCKNNLTAATRLERHQALEFERHFGSLPVAEREERAVATGTLGGVIPPQYLVGLYAKASAQRPGVRRPGEPPRPAAGRRHVA
jgi:hypothetical protein